MELVGTAGGKDELHGGEDGALGRIKCRWKFSGTGLGEIGAPRESLAGELVSILGSSSGLTDCRLL